MSTDGILFIVRDSRQEIREMSQDEKDMYHCQEFESQMFPAGSSSGGGRRGVQETGVKITVKTKEPKKEK